MNQAASPPPAAAPHPEAACPRSRPPSTDRIRAFGLLWFDFAAPCRGHPAPPHNTLADPLPATPAPPGPSLNRMRYGG
jgi:hypothetical protein